MCELFGVCAAENIRANELLDAFFHHSNVHKDGWGLAVFRGNAVTLEKEPEKAISSTYLKHRMSQPIIGSNMLAHIRYATMGRIEYANCHPFVWDDSSGRTWTLIHNGTIFEGDLLAPFVSMQEGTTDSERILLYIVSRMNEFIKETGRAPKVEERFAILDHITVDLSQGNKLNMILYDGEYMYVHTNCREGLHQWHKPGKYLFVTKPIVHGDWKAVGMNQLRAYRAGHEIFSGTVHPYEFRDEEHDMTWILAAYAEL